MPGTSTLIEPWWKTLRSLALKGRHFNLWNEMIEPIRRATAYWNDHKHPYVWGKRKRQRRACKYSVSLLCLVRSVFSGWTNKELHFKSTQLRVKSVWLEDVCIYNRLNIGVIDGLPFGSKEMQYKCSYRNRLN